MTVAEVPMKLFVEEAVESVDELFSVGAEIARNALMFLEVKAEQAANFHERDS